MYQNCVVVRFKLIGKNLHSLENKKMKGKSLHSVWIRKDKKERFIIAVQTQTAPANKIQKNISDSCDLATSELERTTKVTARRGNGGLNYTLCQNNIQKCNPSTSNWCCCFLEKQKINKANDLEEERVTVKTLI